MHRAERARCRKSRPACGSSGWLTDRFGLSWQIVPRMLAEMLRDADAAKANSVTQAMLKMIKLDIAGLRQTYNQA